MKQFFILLSCIIMVFYTCKRKPDETPGNKYKYINTRSGLRMRDTPDMSGKILYTLPFCARVNVIKEKKPEMKIQNRSGRWTYVSFQKKNGWVFGGFLSKDIPENVMYHCNIWYSCEKNEKPICNMEKNKNFNTEKCARALEKLRSKKYRKFFLRKGIGLHVFIENGKRVVFNDEKKDPPNVFSYSFLRYIPEINHYLLAITKWEGLDFMLVNRLNGQKHSLIEIPLFSKDFSRFLTASYCIEAGYCINGLEIWHYKNNTLTREFQMLETKKWGPYAPRWISNNKIVFIKRKLVEFGESYISVAYLIFEKNRWILKE